MGDNVVILLHVDEAERIERRPSLGRDIRRAITVAHHEGKARIYGGFRIVDHYDSDEYHLVLVGGNAACVVRRDRMLSLKDAEKESVRRDVQKLADYLGYDLVKKRVVPKQEQTPDLFPKK